MERVDFNYRFDDVTDQKVVARTLTDKDGEGITCSDVCEAFVDFMVSAGFAEHNIYDYFAEFVN